MSAVGEYEKYAAGHQAVYLKTAADAALAELKAENERLRWMFDHCHIMYETFDGHGECDGCKKVLARLSKRYDVVRQTL